MTGVKGLLLNTESLYLHRTVIPETRPICFDRTGAFRSQKEGATTEVKCRFTVSFFRKDVRSRADPGVSVSSKPFRNRRCVVNFRGWVVGLPGDRRVKFGGVTGLSSEAPSKRRLRTQITNSVPTKTLYLDESLDSGGGRGLRTSRDWSPLGPVGPVGG